MAMRISSAFAVHSGDWLSGETVAPHGLSVTDAAPPSRRDAPGDE